MFLQSLYTRIIFYTGLEAVLYQGILCIHQIILYRKAGAELFGTAGAAFSFLFLCITYTNIGLDSSFATFFNQAGASKLFFRRLIGYQLLGAVTSLIGICFGLYAGYAYYFCNQTWAMSYSPAFVVLFLILLCVESLKKTMRTLAHLALLQKYVAFVEIATLCMYVCSIWGLFWYNGSGTMYAVFAPMLVTSCLALCCYVHLLYNYYAQLPDTSCVDTDICWRSVGNIRLKNWLYHIIHSIYSSNFLVLAVATLYGLKLAALLKVISYCMYVLNYIVQHVFGIVSNVIFSRSKDYAPLEMHRHFTVLRTLLYRVLLCCPLIVLGCYYYVSALYPEMSFEHMHIVILFVLLLFSENTAVAHEHYYLVLGRTHILIIAHVVVLAIIKVCTYSSFVHQTPALFIYIFLALRFFNLWYLEYVDRLSGLFRSIDFKKYRLLFVQKCVTK